MSTTEFQPTYGPPLSRRNLIHGVKLDNQGLCKGVFPTSRLGDLLMWVEARLCIFSRYISWMNFKRS